MHRKLPPLNALPSFEAAARHLSFSRAADELRVTHGAVSRAVRNLEDHLGVQLMVRATRSVRLTPIGASFAAEVRDDERRARLLGIAGVPFFAIDERYGVSGAQSAELLLEALTVARAERAPASR